MKKIIRLGTRSSPLALIQAQIVRDELIKAYVKDAHLFEIEIVPMRTNGDWRPEHREKTFLEMGATKGLFTKEIEEALLNNTIDLAVHSMKDVAAVVPAGLVFAAILQREDPRDALLSPLAPCLADLPAGARIGTSSLRRRAQVLAARPDLTVVPLRGNVDTRLRKLAAEEADATILAVAGLARLGLMEKISSVFETEVMLPAAAQGCLGIQVRENDMEMRNWVQSINHLPSQLCCWAERAGLRALDGSCRTPIGLLATYHAKEGRNFIHLEAMVARSDGTRLERRSLEGLAHEAEKLGQKLGESMKAELPVDFFESCD